MAAGSIASGLFLAFAIIGLILLIVGIVFLVKNIKWKKEKDAQGIKSTINVVAIVLFGFMIFFGLMWLICFGVGAIAFWLAF